MAIPDPLRSLLYESGGLIQQCDACQCAQRGHKVELVDCPQCGTRLTAPVAISFGGLCVSFRGKNFHIVNRRSWAVIEGNDAPEALLFMCKHVIDRRSGNLIHDAGHPRRVPWRDDISGHFFTGG
jgi:hypothetical protein